MEGPSIPKGQEWNVDFFAIIMAFDLQKRLDMQKIAEDLMKKKTCCEAIFIPWIEKPVFLKNLKKRDSNALPWHDFNEINMYVKQKRISKKDKLFLAAIGSERNAFDHCYLSAKKFMRIKLPEIRIQFKSKSLSKLGEMDAELHVLIHLTGIIIGTIYIRPPFGETLNTFQIIELERVLQEDEDIKIDGCEVTLREYFLSRLEKLFLKELENVGISVAIKKLKERDCLQKELRYAVCIRRCSNVFKLLDINSKEVYGILNSMRGWYMLDEKEVKIEELYKRRDFHIFVGNSGYLFCGFDEFDKNLKEIRKNFKEKKIYGEREFLYTFPEYFEHYVVTPLEFISIIDSILERSFKKLQEVSHNFSRHYWKAIKLVGEWSDVHQECNNIIFMQAKPIWRILRIGEKHLGVLEKLKATESNILTLTNMTQQDAMLRINVGFIIFSIILGMLPLAPSDILWKPIVVSVWNIPLWVIFVFLLALAVKISGFRVTFFTLKDAIFSLGDIKELITDLRLFLTTILEIKLKRIPKRSYKQYLLNRF